MTTLDSATNILSPAPQHGRRDPSLHAHRLGARVGGFGLARLIALCIGAGALRAEEIEYNARPHLAPDAQLKVSRELARSWRDGDRSMQSRGGRTIRSRCGSLTVGDFRNVKRPPREVVIIVRDIINLNINCR